MQGLLPEVLLRVGNVIWRSRLSCFSGELVAKVPGHAGSNPASRLSQERVRFWFRKGSDGKTGVQTLNSILGRSAIYDAGVSP